MPLEDWLPPLGVGVVFTALGLIKLLGLKRGIVGGAGKPALQRLCGTCPDWKSQGLRREVPLFFLVWGLGFLFRFLWILVQNRSRS